jgi:hypothetical protein
MEVSHLRRRRHSDGISQSSEGIISNGFPMIPVAAESYSQTAQGLGGWRHVGVSVFKSHTIYKLWIA